MYEEKEVPKEERRRSIKEAIEHRADNWVHRSKGMRCSSCIWFVLKEKAYDISQPIDSRDIGRCRKHAPTINGFPAVFKSDWCGDHRIDENKI